MDPLDFLNVAASLCESGEEAERRTSVGRSYFALFNHLRIKLAAITQIPTTDEAHQAVVHYLTHANNRNLSSVGQSLRDLRSSRNVADYKLDGTVDQADSRVALVKAKSAFGKLSTVGDNALRSAVQAVPAFRSRRN